MVRVRVDQSATPEDGAALWPTYDAVFGDQPDETTWRETMWDRHRVREGFRLARAYAGDRLVGFAYGYTGRSGQWWTDRAREVLTPEVAEAWLGGHFEVVTVAVVEEARGDGVGRALLRALLDGLPHDRLLLMATDEPANPARRLYASEGWEVVGPGTGEHTVIMGRLNPPAGAPAGRVP